MLDYHKQKLKEINQHTSTPLRELHSFRKENNELIHLIYTSLDDQTGSWQHNFESKA